MNDKIIRSIGRLFLLTMVGVMCMALLQGNSYTKSYTIVTAPTQYGKDWIRFTHVFVTRTDTVYMPFTLRWRTQSGVLDTTMAILNLRTAKTSDSINTSFWYQYSTDNSNWSVKRELFTDSTVGTRTGDTLKTIMLSRPQYAGLQPFSRILIIGNTALAGGKANEAGNTVKVDIIEQ
jgi:hypothetical protein